VLTELEHEVIDDLAKVYNKFNMLMDHGDSRRDDLVEVAMLIHGLQDKVLAQAAARLYPAKYRLLGGSAHYGGS
jgi:hypothetical protein